MSISSTKEYFYVKGMGVKIMTIHVQMILYVPFMSSNVGI